MKREYAYKYMVEVLVDPASFSAIQGVNSSLFTRDDSNFAKGDIKDRPLDFDLHLGVYLLLEEGLPEELLEPIKQWCREHPMVIVGANQ